MLFQISIELKAGSEKLKTFIDLLNDPFIGLTAMAEFFAPRWYQYSNYKTIGKRVFRL